MHAVQPHHRAIPSDADRVVLAMSDIEMGCGGPLDDFPHSDWLAELLLEAVAAVPAGVAVDLVFHGDTFDFLKTPYLDDYPRHITRDVALGKLLRIAAAHPKFFEGLRRFLDDGAGARRVHLLTGNHDFELLFDEVQATIRTLVGGTADNVLFPGFRTQLGDALFEHGHQADRLFAMDPARPFVEHQGDRILNLPWAAVALLDVAMPLHPLVYHHDRLKPRGRVFELLPELRELAVSRYWTYWTRDYWKGWLRNTDPVRRLRWTMFREVISRFGSRSINLHLDDDFEHLLHADDGPRVVVIGHLHQAGWRSYGDRKLLQTGAMRNEFMMSRDGTLLSPMPKIYAEVVQREGRTVRSELVEVQGPPTPEGYVPDSVFDVRPRVLELLGEVADRAEVQKALADQERQEAEEPVEAS